MNKVAVALALLALTAAPLRAAEDDAARAERWKDLQQAVFGQRPLQDAGALVTLDAPTRALDPSLVPIAVTIDPSVHVKALYITVDGNPSPLVGTFHFGPAAEPHLIRTRVRVEQYTLMHAVVETDDGRLLATERFVKASGGCSAPMTKDAKLAMTRLGQMRLHIEGEPAAPGGVETAQLLISHPNNNGMQVDQLTHNFVPARYIQDVKVSSGNQPVFTLESDISLSEDPAISFEFKPSGPLTVEVDDSSRAVFKQSFDVPVGGS